MSKLAGIVLTVFAATIAAVALVHAQTFPDRPIKVIVAYPAGGPTDTVARLATQNIAEQLGQGMIVENVAGAGGRIGTRDVARAAPDGYTLLLGGTNDNAIAPVLYKSLDYDPAKDFVPVSALATELERDRGQSVGAGEYARGACELYQGQSGQAHVGRDARHRAASVARIHPGANRRRHGVRAL